MGPIRVALFGLLCCAVVVFVGPLDWWAVVAAFAAGGLTFVIIDALLDP